MNYASVASFHQIYNGANGVVYDKMKFYREGGVLTQLSAFNGTDNVLANWNTNRARNATTKGDHTFTIYNESDNMIFEMICGKNNLVSGSDVGGTSVSTPLIAINIDTALNVEDPEGITPNSKYINLKELGINNTNFFIEGLSRAELKTDVDGHGAVSGVSYSLYQDENVLLMYLQIFPEDHTYDNFEFRYNSNLLSLRNYDNYSRSTPCRLRRVKFASVEQRNTEND